MKCDVAIIGGGPAGSTTGSLLKKYASHLDVAIFERERFPRDHVGESQLPMVCEILQEMGAWDKVERANFPIKVGAVYRWGSSSDLWQFEFLPGAKLDSIPRPAEFKGQRAQTAFQVDRSVYDTILLRHAEELGCKVFEDSQVTAFTVEEDRVTSMEVKGLGNVEARYFVDASGNSALLRKKLGIDVDAPTSLRNIAIWDYWQDAEWAERTGVGGTTVRVMSLGWGWIWFIPISETRTSIGLVTSAEYFKKSGLSPEDLYAKSVAAESLISDLTKNATREGKLQTTNDWSYIAQKLCGPNWFLAGDSCGFADPILSAGMTLAQISGRKVAFSILELERGKVEADWILREYDRGHRANIASHIRFADFWYSANAHFTDLKEYCSQIAADAGLSLGADAAFQWLGTGGFTNDILGKPSAATFRLIEAKVVAARFSGEVFHWQAMAGNRFDLNLKGASEGFVGSYEQGSVRKVGCYRRNRKTLPKAGAFGEVIKAIKKESGAVKAMDIAWRQVWDRYRDLNPAEAWGLTLETIESMIVEGWITTSQVPGLPNITFPGE